MNSFERAVHARQQKNGKLKKKREKRDIKKSFIELLLVQHIVISFVKSVFVVKSSH